LSSVDRADLETRLRDQGREPSSWSNEPGYRYGAHSHGYDKIVVAIEGSVTFGLVGDGVGITLTPGERLDLPAGVEHDALVGPRGVVCLEVHLQSGTLGHGARARGYRW
jgi:quercetin dioxygenase-like cupin family protein